METESPMMSTRLCDAGPGRHARRAGTNNGGGGSGGDGDGDGEVLTHTSQGGLLMSEPAWAPPNSFAVGMRERGHAGSSAKALQPGCASQALAAACTHAGRAVEKLQPPRGSSSGSAIAVVQRLPLPGQLFEWHAYPVGLVP